MCPAFRTKNKTTSGISEIFTAQITFFAIINVIALANMGRIKILNRIILLWMSGVARVRYKNPGGAALTRATGQHPERTNRSPEKAFTPHPGVGNSAARDPHPGPLPKRERGKGCSIGPLSLRERGKDYPTM
ncbi:hypothetical protein AB182_25800 [Phytobacter ursingii]|uniref:Uncharacterized protein n=1 Tax=Phytobacter ursingii TaxID=1972431 RepID=A0AAC8QTG2_9ENTR|nr:hypothetical protein AB182_25800 [Phytobacter ursingii]